MRPIIPFNTLNTFFIIFESRMIIKRLLYVMDAFKTSFVCYGYCKDVSETFCVHWVSTNFSRSTSAFSMVLITIRYSFTKPETLVKKCLKTGFGYLT